MPVRMVLIGVTVGAASIVASGYLWPALEKWINSDPSQFLARARLVLLGAALLLVAPLVAIAIWLWRLGARALAGDRFPPPGVAVIRDTPVLTGDAARRRARLAQSFAIFLLAAAGAMAILFWRLSRMFLGES